MTADTLPYLNPALPFEARAADLVARMTLPEKISQMQNDAPAVERLQIPPYNWWNECLHGVGRAGTATVFPQAIGLAATWNIELLQQVAVAISDEARAKHHDALRQGEHKQYFGLTFWSPNINILRDPRWGRGQETYGEDPYLTGRLAVAFIRGLQGDDPRYLKVAACAKHFAVHSGPENLRHEFDAQASARDLWETYLPAFEASVVEANVESVMGAYNRVNGEAACASPTLLGEILRGKWGFTGHVVSDCGAINDIFQHHHVADTAEAGVALAVHHGCDLECGCAYEALKGAVEQGLIPVQEIDRALTRLFTSRMKLGMFDAPETVPYAQIPMDVVDSAEHRALALQAAREAIVLLKNDGFLPLTRKLKRIAVIGPNADDEVALWGNYNGTPSRTITPLAGIRARAGSDAEVVYAKGCLVAGRDASGYDEAIAAAQSADAIIFVGGLSQWLEGEEGENAGVPPGEQASADRSGIALPTIQENLLHALHETGRPVVLVLVNGGAIAAQWADVHLPAIVESWYSGQEGGTALADVLFGDYNPAGRLPVTFYQSTEDLPPITDYRMAQRTYRYFTGSVLYPFGHGLSYTTFSYAHLLVTPEHIERGQPARVTVSVDVTNSGNRAGDEVVQLYVHHDAQPELRWKLAGFRRITLQPGETQHVEFVLDDERLTCVQDDGSRAVIPGTITVYAGGGQPGIDTRSASLRIIPH